MIDPLFDLIIFVVLIHMGVYVFYNTYSMYIRIYTVNIKSSICWKFQFCEILFLKYCNKFSYKFISFYFEIPTKGELGLANPEVSILPDK